MVEEKGDNDCDSRMDVPDEEWKSDGERGWEKAGETKNNSVESQELLQTDFSTMKDPTSAKKVEEVEDFSQKVFF